MRKFFIFCAVLLLYYMEEGIGLKEEGIGLMEERIRLKEEGI